MIDPDEVSKTVILSMFRNLDGLGVRGRRRDAYAIEFITGALVALQSAGLQDCAAKLATDAAIAIASKTQERRFDISTLVEPELDQE